MPTHATVTPLTANHQDPVSVAEAIEAFLATPRVNTSTNTHRAYTGVLHRIANQLGPTRALANIDHTEIGAAITTEWRHAAPATFNRNRAAVASWLSWCATKAHWNAPTLPDTCERRAQPRDQTRAVDRATIERICTRRDIPLRERLLWRMLYETASRASEVLALNVEDCDFDNRRARVTSKGDHTDWIVWGRGSALLLPRYLHGRHTGPLFCSERRPGPTRRATTPNRDICPETRRIRLGYDRARILINHYTGLNLHTLRHSAATHLAENGVDATIIMAKGHWQSIRTAARYTKPGLAAITTATEQLNPPHQRP